MSWSARARRMWIGLMVLAVAGCDCGETPGGSNPDAAGGFPDGTARDGGDAGVIEDTGVDDLGVDGGGVDDTGVVDDGGVDDTGVVEDSGVDDTGVDDTGMTGDGGADDAGDPDDGAIADGGDDAGDPSDGGPQGPDAGAGDAADPLDQPLEEFCSGAGAVVSPGGNTVDCSGNLARNTFQYAICTCEGITVPSNLEVDAFDSRLGPYAATTTAGPNIFEDGHIGVNGILGINGMANVLGSVFVAGGGFQVGQQSFISINVYAADDANQVNSFSTIGRHMFIDGDVFGRYDIAQNLYVPAGASVSAQTSQNIGGQIVRGAIPQITPCPCGPGEIVDVQAYVDFGETHNDNAAIGVLTSTTWATGTGPNTITLPCGRYYLTEILHPQGITIHATGRTVLYVDGNVTLGGGLRIEVDQGAELDFFIAGSLALQAASRLGEVERPSAVRTYIGGANPIVIQANSLFGGNLYAPSADVVFSASADLYGALFCRNAIFGGATDVHFDRSIRAAADECDAGTGDGGPAGDAGTGPDDAGVGPDGGPPGDGGSPDAETPCTMCTECGNQQACLIPPDAGVGICGPCMSDLDCCPFEICDENTGLCRPTL